MKQTTVALSALGLALGMVIAGATDADARGRRPGVYHRGPTVVYRPARPYRVYPRYRGYRYVAPLVGGVIIGDAVRRNYYSSRGLSCGELERRCDAGQDWACDRLDVIPEC